MKSELFWALDDDLFAFWIPSYHVLILWFLEKTMDEIVMGARVSKKWRMMRTLAKGLHTCRVL